MPKTQHLKPKLFVNQNTFHGGKIYRSVTTRIWETSKPIIGLYLIVTVGNIICSYFTSEWESVLVTFTVAIITLALGLYMIKQVVTTQPE